MARVARAAAQRGLRTILTTTTSVWLHRWRAFSAPVLASSREEALRRARDATGPFLFLARDVRPGPAPHVSGVPADWVDALAEEGTHDVLLVKAEARSGERGERLPARTHRWVTVGTFSSTGGWVEHLVPRERPGGQGSWRTLVLLGRTGPEAHRVARHCLAEARVQEVAFADVQGREVAEVWGRVAAVILAAGAGTRFGGPKQVARWRGRPLLWHVLNAVEQADVDEVLVVVGAHRDAVVPWVERWNRERGGRARVVVNPDWAQGQSTSVRAGLRAVGDVHAVLFPLADQPRISPQLLQALIAEHRRTLAGIVMPTYHGHPGAPVLFDRRHFAELEALQGDVGGRVLVRAYWDQVHRVEWPDPDAGWDVDVPADLEE